MSRQWGFGEIILATLTLVVLGGCGASGSNSGEEKDWMKWDSTADTAPDVLREVRGEDAAEVKLDSELHSDVAQDLELLEEGGINWPCSKDSDCNSGHCLDLGDNSVCTVLCPEGECPSDWKCKTVVDSAPKPVLICVPDMGTRCAACELDEDCAPEGDRCLAFGEGVGLGLWCMEDCSVGGKCAPDYTCKEVKDSVSGLYKGTFCVPNNNSCYCSPEIEKTTRPCSRKNQWGECQGEEICVGNLGWVDCSAPLPSVEYCDGKDNDCDGSVDEEYYITLPNDQGKAYAGQPCSVGICTGGTVICKNLSEAMCSAVTQGQTEVCNGLDDDCDGLVDEYVIKKFYKDIDGDGFAAVNDDFVEGCEAPEGYSGFTNDCNEGDPEVAGGLPELCDYKDNNCNDMVDEGLFLALPNQQPIFLGNPCGSGACEGGVVVCQDKHTLTCSSFDQAVPEICNGIDDDCDGKVDNGCDDDLDGYCDATMEIIGKPPICKYTALDCNDEDKFINPGRNEYCNNKDDNCDGLLDNDVIDCAANSCTGDGKAFMETISAACVEGECQAPGAKSCGYYACEDGGGPGKKCLESCSFDIQCVPNAHCEESTGSCRPDVPNSGGCVQNSDCASNYCSNGYCCSSGLCCSTSADCPAQYWEAPTCQFTPSCQGQRRDAVCDDGQCKAGPPIPDDTGCTSAFKAKDCGAYQAIHCNGKLDQSEPLCPTWCLEDSECRDGFHCDQICVPDLADASFCDEASDCASGHCQNGFCCASGDCCAQAIDCNSLVYAEASTCVDPGNCQGFRRDPVCINAMCGKSDPIGDDSGCLLQVADPCGPYKDVVCNANIAQNKPPCGNTCVTNSECDPTSHCQLGKCISDVNAGEECYSTLDCADGLYCVDGVCCNSPCEGLCRSCVVPGFEGTCVNIPSGQDPEGECLEVDCSTFFHGWDAGKCRMRENAPASSSSCDGNGQCTPPAAVCGSMGAGAVAKDCTGQCQAPDPNTCTGTVMPVCQFADTGPIVCGVGACARIVQGCENGVPQQCVPAPPGEETCNGIDDDCNGLIDDGLANAIDTYEPNNNCEGKHYLGYVEEGKPATTWTATMYPSWDVDFFEIDAVEAEHTCMPLFNQNYTLEIKVVPPPSATCRDYDIFIYDTNCLLIKSATSSSCTQELLKYEWTGTCAFDDSIAVRIKVVPWTESYDCAPYSLSVKMY